MFLLGNGLDRLIGEGDDDALSMHRRAEQARRLVLPGEMGERFKAIGLQRGIDASALFAMGERSGSL